MSTEYKPTFKFARTGATTGDETKRAKLYYADHYGAVGRALAKGENKPAPIQPTPTDYTKETRPMFTPDYTRFLAEKERDEEYKEDILASLHSSCDTNILLEVKAHKDYTTAIKAKDCAKLISIIEHVLRHPAHDKESVLRDQVLAYESVAYTTDLATFHADMRTAKERVITTHTIMYGPASAKTYEKQKRHGEHMAYIRALLPFPQLVHFHTWASLQSQDFGDIGVFMAKAEEYEVAWNETHPKPNAPKTLPGTKQVVAQILTSAHEGTGTWRQEGGPTAFYAGQPLSSQRQRTSSRQPTYQIPCRNWERNSCTYNPCKYLHDPTRRGINAQHSKSKSHRTSSAGKGGGPWCDYCAQKHGTDNANHHPSQCTKRPNNAGGDDGQDRDGQHKKSRSE